MATVTATQTHHDVAVAKTVRILMAAQDMSQSDLAARINLDSSSISRVMNGKRRWTLDELYRIADVFDIDICDLFQPEVTVRSRCSFDQPRLFALAA